MIAPLLPYLSSYSWPGNVRELENIADRIAVLMLHSEAAKPSSYDGLRDACPELFLPEKLSTTDDAGQFDLRVAEVLKSSKGNRTMAAQQLGISRSTLWRRMKKKDDGDAGG